MYPLRQAVPKNPATALDWYRKAAEQGNPLSAYNAAECCGPERKYQQMQNRPPCRTRKRPRRAFFSAKPLGRFYDRGEGVPLDRGRASSWYQKAAEGGDAQAQAELGRFLCSGIGWIRTRSRVTNGLLSVPTRQWRGSCLDVRDGADHYPGPVQSRQRSGRYLPSRAFSRDGET